MFIHTKKEWVITSATPSELIKFNFPTCVQIMKVPQEEIKQQWNWDSFLNSDGYGWSAAVRLSDNIITAIFKQHWQTQYVPGLSTAAESIVDSEMLILFVYFLLMFRCFPVQTCLGIFMTKNTTLFFILERTSSLFFFLPQSSGKRHNPLW